VGSIVGKNNADTKMMSESILINALETEERINVEELNLSLFYSNDKIRWFSLTFTILALYGIHFFGFIYGAYFLFYFANVSNTEFLTDFSLVFVFLAYMYWFFAQPLLQWLSIHKNHRKDSFKEIFSSIKAFCHQSIPIIIRIYPAILFNGIIQGLNALSKNKDIIKSYLLEDFDLSLLFPDPMNSPTISLFVLTNFSFICLFGIVLADMVYSKKRVDNIGNAMNLEMTDDKIISVPFDVKLKQLIDELQRYYTVALVIVLGFLFSLFLLSFKLFEDFDVIHYIIGGTIILVIIYIVDGLINSTFRDSTLLRLKKKCISQVEKKIEQIDRVNKDQLTAKDVYIRIQYSSLVEKHKSARIFGKLKLQAVLKLILPVVLVQVLSILPS